MVRYSVIVGKSSEELGEKLSKKLKAKLIRSQIKVFPDGESKITLSNKPTKHCIVVQSTYPPVDTNLVQALSLISKAKEHADSVTAVIPYMGYARQDREFLPGEIVTMNVIANLFKGSGVTSLIVVDIHSVIGLKYFKIKTKNVSAIPDLVKYFKKMNLKNPLIVSPDQGGKERAEKFAENFKSNYIALTKKRDRKSGKVEIKNAELEEVRGRDLILVDDMISTGGSIIKATQFLKKQKCRRVYVACTHALLMNNAEARIRKAGVTKIVSANTIPGKTSVVDVSNSIAKAII